MWDPGTAGILEFPSGRRVRGRALSRPLPAGLQPHFGLYLVNKPPPPVAWAWYWLRWLDFWLPTDTAEARRCLADAWERAATERVELACAGGRGRTGTALACLAVLDGVPPAEAVRFVRAGYDRHAVEMPWQHRYVARFAGA